VTGHYDAQDRLTAFGSTTYTYDLNGDLESKTEGSQTTTYEYDSFGNLRQVTLPDSTRIENVVDGKNHRVARKVNGAMQKGHLWQGQHRVVAELDSRVGFVGRGDL
jgi:YD repeat-containing protein